MKIIDLRCEYLSDPLGIDVRRPRLSWRIDAPGEKNLKQVAYRICVGSRLGENDLWDSGRVESDQTTQIEYAGVPLASRQQCYWQVQIWDGKTTATSDSARWS